MLIGKLTALDSIVRVFSVKDVSMSVVVVAVN